LFVGNDTGTAHLAAAMNCPTVVVSRHPANGDPTHPNSPARFAPRGARFRVLQPQTGKGECLASCREPGTHCILQITVEKVLDAAMELLPRERAQSRVASTGLPFIEPSVVESAMVLA